MRAHRTAAPAFEREAMPETERTLLCRDVAAVADEYFELDGAAEADVTRTADGYSVCILLHARRIKYIKNIPR